MERWEIQEQIIEEVKQESQSWREKHLNNHKKGFGGLRNPGRPKWPDFSEIDYNREYLSMPENLNSKTEHKIVREMFKSSEG